MRSTFFAFALAYTAVVAPTRAAADEAWIVTATAGLGTPIGAPQSEWFGPGATGTVGVLRSVGPGLLLGARVRGLLLADGDAPSNPRLADPGNGTLVSGAAVARLRLPRDAADVRRAVGPWLEVGAGGALTGDLARVTFEIGAGIGFEAGALSLGPGAWYVHVLQPGGLDDRDAHMVFVGLELAFLDLRPAPPPPPPPPGPSDRDRDGIIDDDDACPDNPEDRDSFEDLDGCPELDNDRDGLLDTADECPLEPEDRDNFLDDDGCPDTDNDGDGFLDADDTCPNERETINGVNDHDGCPDEGVIELVDDRVILEERVLFDFGRARVKRAARPVLEAIVNLYRQQGDWTRMRVEGHADSRGDAAFNLALSERRAQNVRDELVRLGAPGGIIDFVGFGASRLRDQGSTEEAHARNRRVEFVVVARGQAGAAPTARELDGEEDAR